ncbi:MAG: hypothetical protein R3B69_02870 [Candidatus Paceibacterota bacterium]
MINLIPPSARKLIVREYWIRVITVWFLLITFALWIFLALQVPTYILIDSLHDALVTQFDRAQAEHTEFSELEAEVKKINTLVSHLGAHEDDVYFSELIAELDQRAVAGVTLTQFAMKREEGALKEIDLVGVAPTRTSLSNFRDALEAHERFSKAELPISNLAKERDITFSMKVTMASD